MMLPKRRPLIFAFFMALFMSGIMSFVLTVFNVGIVANLLTLWLQAWGLAIIVALPPITVLAPFVDKLVSIVLGEAGAIDEQ
jgi:hypothetical protein